MGSDLFRTLAPLALLWLCGGCVISTYGGPAEEPQIPLAPEKVASSEATAVVPEGPAEIGARHILISYRGAMRAAPYIKRTKEEAAELANQLREQAVSGTDFTVLAEENSDDPGSAAQGGSLGQFSRAEMVPEFSNAAFVLEIGGVSEVVESPFGFHIIQRTE
jgi:hypothetical protein